MNTLNTTIDISICSGYLEVQVEFDFDLYPAYDGSGETLTGMTAEITDSRYLSGDTWNPLPEFLLEGTNTKSIEDECIRQALKQGEEAYVEKKVSEYQEQANELMFGQYRGKGYESSNP